MICFATKYRLKISVRVIIVTILILVLVFLAECNPEVDREEIPEGWKSLDEIPNNPAYVTLPLTAIRWQLVGFVDGEKNIIRPVIQTVPYVIYFRDDYVIGGQIYINKIRGEYSSLGEGSIQMDVDIIKHVTEYGMEDADLFIEALNDAHTFTVTEKGLQLYYGDQQYLLFKCAFDNRCLQVINCGDEDYSDKVCSDESISGAWKAHKIRLNISGSLCEVIPPSGTPGYLGNPTYPDISIILPTPIGSSSTTFYNRIAVSYELSDNNQISLNYADLTRDGEDDWGISLTDNLLNTATYCLAGDELVFFDEKDLPLIVFIKK